MAIPVEGGAHIDVPLSNFAVSAFSEGTNEFIGDQVFPVVPVGKESDKYYTITKDSFFRVEDARRGRKTQARRVEFEVSSDSYYAHNYALAGEIALEDRANADTAIMLEQNTVRNLVTNLRRAQEERIANLIGSATNVGSGVLLTGTSKWNDFVNSDPLSAINTAHAFIRQQTGLVPNTAIVDWDTMMVLRRHPRVLDLFKYTSGGEATDTQLQEVLKVDRLLVGKAIKENDLEGGTSSITNVWGNKCILAHINTTPSLMTATPGMRFQWRPDGFAAPFAVERRVETGAGTRKVVVLEAGHFQDEKITAANLAYVIDTTL